MIRFSPRNLSGTQSDIDMVALLAWIREKIHQLSYCPDGEPKLREFRYVPPRRPGESEEDHKKRIQTVECAWNEKAHQWKKRSQYDRPRLDKEGKQVVIDGEPMWDPIYTIQLSVKKLTYREQAERLCSIFPVEMRNWKTIQGLNIIEKILARLDTSTKENRRIVRNIDDPFKLARQRREKNEREKGERAELKALSQDDYVNRLVTSIYG